MSCCSGQAWRTGSCPQCQTLSPPPHQSSRPPLQHLHLLPPLVDHHSPPRIDPPAGSLPQGRGTWTRRRGETRRREGWLRGGEASLVREDQVQHWEGEGAGYLSLGTKAGGGSAGERGKNITVARECNAVQSSLLRRYFSGLPVSLILAPTVWTRGLKLSSSYWVEQGQVVEAATVALLLIWLPALEGGAI